MKLIFQLDTFILVAIVTLCDCYEKTKVLQTRAGRFIGSVRTLEVSGKTMEVERYLGVPYAETPKRFQRARVKAAMDHEIIYDATKFRASCSQQEIPLRGERKPDLNWPKTSEDCLFLNIYKPAGKSDKPRSVMVFFYGGGFVCGSTQMYSGDFLASYGDVLFIPVTYRLSALGFLSTGDSTLPGNLGLWDQHTALLWIHENIADFGGDPESVTILGGSAGSSSVVYQSIFPRNKGLFQRAIGISGSITCPWSFQPNPLDVFHRFASHLGCSTESTAKKIVRCIESKSIQEIESTLNNPGNNYIKFPMDLVTVVDGEFLTSSPYNIISHDSELSSEAKEFFSSLDFMTGITSGEGAMNIHPFVGVWNTFEFAPSREEFEEKLIPEAVKIMYGDNVPNVVIDMIIHKYTNWTDPDSVEHVRQSFLDMTGAYVFDFHAKLIADMHANLSSSTRDGNTYAYLVEALPSQQLMEVPSWVTKPNHADDLVFLQGYDKEGWLQWTTPYTEDYQPEDWELETSKLYMTLFTNFAKTG